MLSPNPGQTWLLRQGSCPQMGARSPHTPATHRVVVKTAYNVLIVGLLSNACWKAEKGQ